MFDPICKAVKRRMFRSCACLSVLLLLNGCVIVSPRVSVREVLDVVISSATEISSANEKPSSVAANRIPFKNLCIELNPAVTVQDFLPAVQQELNLRGVASRVFGEGTAPLTCEAILNYEATREWDDRIASNEALPYMNYARLTLRRDGALISSANYGIGGLGFDKWSSTRTKVKSMIDILLVGN